MFTTRPNHFLDSSIWIAHLPDPALDQLSPLICYSSWSIKFISCQTWRVYKHPADTKGYQDMRHLLSSPCSNVFPAQNWRKPAFFLSRWLMFKKISRHRFRSSNLWRKMTTLTWVNVHNTILSKKSTIYLFMERQTLVIVGFLFISDLKSFVSHGIFIHR